MKSIKFSESIVINKPNSVVFDYTQDYENRLSWDTFLQEATLINNATKAGKGVRAWCVAKNGFGMETEYVTFNRPLVTAIKMTRGPFIFRKFLGSWTFKEISPSTTQVIFLYSFSLRFPVNLFRFFVRRNLRKNVRKRLADLKAAVEGVSVTS